MLYKIKKFLALSMQRKFLFIEAYYILGMTRIAILWFPFKKLTRNLTQQRTPFSLPLLRSIDEEVALDIKKAMKQASAYAPWGSSCLAQSLTAQKMLKKRAISGVIYIGVKREKNKQKDLQAHAWVQTGEYIIAGEKDSKSFAIVSVFRWEG